MVLYKKHRNQTKRETADIIYLIYPTSPREQDVTQDQFQAEFNWLEFRVFPSRLVAKPRLKSPIC